MKVLQTLGRCRGIQEGIFGYKRTSMSIHIDLSVGHATTTPSAITITNQEWNNILTAIEIARQKSFRLTPQAARTQSPPNQVLYDVIAQAIPNPSGGWNWCDSFKAAICAILEHEGSIDLYHGTLGRGHSVCIALSRDIP